MTVKRTQKDEAREARLASTAADDILGKLTEHEIENLSKRVRLGFASIGRGDYTDYVGREGLDRLASEVKTRGRNLLTETTKVR